MRLALLLSLSLTACSCQTPKQCGPRVFVAPNDVESTIFACRAVPDEETGQGKLECVDMERFLLQLSADGYDPTGREL